MRPLAIGKPMRVQDKIRGKIVPVRDKILAKIAPVFGKTTDKLDAKRDPIHHRIVQIGDKNAGIRFVIPSTTIILGLTSIKITPTQLVGA